MMRTATVTVAFLFAIWLVVVSGCGGGEDQEPTPTHPPTSSVAATEEASPASSPSPAVETRAELEALLRSMALTLEDLPSGFTLEDEVFTTNEEAARDYLDGEEQGLADYARWGRLLGYEATYSRDVSLGTLVTGGTIYIAVRPTLFEDSEGASEAMDKAKELVSDPEEETAFVEDFEKDSGWEAVELAPMSFTQVGDETTAFQLTGEVSTTELKVPVVAQVVAIRRGRANGMIIVSAAQGPSPIQELEAMAQKFDERITEASE